MHRKHQLLRIEHAKIDQKELLRARKLASAPPPLATLGVTAAPWHATLKRGSVSTTEAGPAPVVVYVKLGSADGAQSFDGEFRNFGVNARAGRRTPASALPHQLTGGLPRVPADSFCATSF